MKFENFLNELRSTSKPKEKQDILLKYDGEILRYLIKATYEPFKMFHVNIKKEDIPPAGSFDLSDRFSDLMLTLLFCESSNSNKQNRQTVQVLLAELNEGSQELVIRILEKNWKVGLSAKNILKIFPDSISSFNVQLAETYDCKAKKHTKVKKWLASYKFDGLRCIALRLEDEWFLYSRKGKEFFTVEHLKPQLERLFKKYGWSFFDGELYKHGLRFEEIQSLVMSFTQGQAPSIEYHCFIAGKAEDFLNCKNPDKMVVLNDDGVYESDIKFTSLGLINAEEIYVLLEKAFEGGYEGIMLRDPNKLYDYKRSTALLKVKESLFQDEEVITSDCVVTDVELNEVPVIENGQMFFEVMAVRFTVRQPNGIKCNVGSGIKLHQKRYYRDHPEEIIEVTVEVKHQGWGNNGKMRFPRLEKIRLDL